MRPFFMRTFLSLEKKLVIYLVNSDLFRIFASSTKDGRRTQISLTIKKDYFT